MLKPWRPSRRRLNQEAGIKPGTVHDEQPLGMTGSYEHPNSGPRRAALPK